MMTPVEREKALAEMRAVAADFYARATHIHVHPFIEFAGLMNEYIKVCEHAHAKGVDFSECNTHNGRDLPMETFEINYVNEKLECIFTGRSVMDEKADYAELRKVLTGLMVACSLLRVHIKAKEPQVMVRSEWKRLHAAMKAVEVVVPPTEPATAYSIEQLRRADKVRHLDC